MAASASESGDSLAMIQGFISINGGTFNQYNSHTRHDSQVLHALRSHINPDLLHDSKRYDGLRDAYDLCPATECQVHNTVKWAIHPNTFDCHPQRILRLNFPSSKKPPGCSTALAISGRLEECGALLAGIILPEEVLTQAAAYQIIYIITYQLVRNIPSVAQCVGNAIQNDPLIFDRNYKVQVEKLIVEPLIEASKDPSDERPLAPIIVVTGSYAQVMEGSPCARIFDTISVLLQQRGLERPWISLILISITPGQLAPILHFMAAAKAVVTGKPVIAIGFIFLFS